MNVDNLGLLNSPWRGLKTISEYETIDLLFSFDIEIHPGPLPRRTNLSKPIITLPDRQTEIGKDKQRRLNIYNYNFYKWKIILYADLQS